MAREPGDSSSHNCNLDVGVREPTNEIRDEIVAMTLNSKKSITTVTWQGFSRNISFLILQFQGKNYLYKCLYSCRRD